MSLKRIPSLDGLRALSIGLVIACHWLNDGRGGDRWFLGNLGVRIFFVISGYLITGLLLAEYERTGTVSLRKFYFRRTLRIFPPFYAYLCVMLLLGTIGWGSLTLEGAGPAFLYITDYYNGFLKYGFAASNSWSLSVEEQFYLLWPWVFVLLGPQRAKWLILTVIAVSPVLRFIQNHCFGPTSCCGPNVFTMLHTNADSLGAGCLLTLVRHQLHDSPLYRRMLGSPAMLVVPVVIFYLNAMRQTHNALHQYVLASVINCSIAVCIDRVVTYPSGPVGWLLNWRPVAGIGILSYSLYLWQQPFTHLHGKYPVLFPGSRFAFLGDPIGCLVASVVCAIASYFLVERPFLILRSWLEVRLFTSATHTSSVEANRRENYFPKSTTGFSLPLGFAGGGKGESHIISGS